MSLRVLFARRLRSSSEPDQIVPEALPFGPPPMAPGASERAWRRLQATLVEERSRRAAARPRPAWSALGWRRAGGLAAAAVIVASIAAGLGPLPGVGRQAWNALRPETASARADFAGTVVSVDSTLLTVQTLSGLEEVALQTQTTLQRPDGAAVPPDGVNPGSRVAVKGTRGSDGRVSAEHVEVEDDDRDESERYSEPTPTTGGAPPSPSPAGATAVPSSSSTPTARPTVTSTPTRSPTGTPSPNPHSDDDEEEHGGEEEGR